MPGLNSEEGAFDYMVPYFLARETINPSNGVLADETKTNYQDTLYEDTVKGSIDLSRSASAQELNTLNLIFKLVGGAANVFEIDLLMHLIGEEAGVAKGLKFLVDTKVGVGVDQPIRFSKLYAGHYSVLIRGMNGGSYDMLASHYDIVTSHLNRLP